MESEERVLLVSYILALFAQPYQSHIFVAASTHSRALTFVLMSRSPEVCRHMSLTCAVRGTLAPYR